MPVEIADLVAMAKVAPEIEGIKQTAAEWWLGLVGLEKSGEYAARARQTWPCWRDGFSRPVRATMRFRAVPFERAGGGAAIAVILTVPEDNRELWVGWVRGERAAEADAWIAEMNGELERLHALWVAAGRPGPTRDYCRSGRISEPSGAAVSVRELIPKHLLRFSLRCDAHDTLDAMRARVEAALGCGLRGEHKYRMFLFAGEVLGMEICSGNGAVWKGDGHFNFTDRPSSPRIIRMIMSS